MKQHDEELSFDDFDEKVNPRPEECDFDRIVEAAISRRGFLGGVLTFGSVAALNGGWAGTAQAAADRFAFDAITTSSADAVTVANGYSAKVLVRWGDPLTSDGPAFDHDTRGTGASQAVTFGDNIDGMEAYAHGDKTLLVVNNEYTNRKIIWGNRAEGKAETDDDVAKGKMAHGVTVVEIAPGADGWDVVLDSPYNRRIHHNTPMAFDGPAARHDLLKTAADPTGAASLGTFNNCGSGRTPWGTYLTCEENFNGYFGTTGELTPGKVHEAGFKRYGVSTDVKPGRYNYHSFNERFDISKHPNEPHRAGYVVEIDPWNPDSTPVKHSALGRFKHENAACTLAQDGRVVIYMGDD